MRVVRISVSGASGVGKSALIERIRAEAADFGVLATEVAAGQFTTDSREPSDVSVMIVDARDGVTAQARQYAASARSSGIRHIVLALNKLDLAGWDRTAFETVEAAFGEFASRFEFTTAAVIPISAVSGENIDTRSARATWYGGPTLLEHLAALHLDADLSRGPNEPQVTEQFAAHIACVSDQELLPGREYKLRLAGQELTASVTAVKYRLDIDSLHREPARTLARGEIGVCTIATHTPLTLGAQPAPPHSDRFILSDLYTDETIAAGSVDFALRRGMNIHWQPLTVTKDLRASLKAQRPCVVWFTGLSGSGKSTIANLVEGWLALHGCHTYLLDGDNVRHGLNKDLGFTAADRVENIRRVGEVARLFVDAGVVVMCSFISPFRAEREAVRSLVDEAEFIKIYVTAPLEVCEHRDPKGLYAKSRAGQLPNFTGIDSPYEAPENPDLVLDTTSAPAAELAQRVVALLQARGVVATAVKHARLTGSL